MERYSGDKHLNFMISRTNQQFVKLTVLWAVGVCVLAILAISVADASSVATSVAYKSNVAATVTAIPVPPVPVARFETDGSFPQVHRSFATGTVNRSLRSLLCRDETQFAAMASRLDRERRAPGRGIYSILLDTALISANSKVVSGLMPWVWVLPAGTPYESWIAFTREV